MSGIDLSTGIVIALVLAAALLAPYLIKEIRKGKARITRRAPVGASEVRPGTIDNPAPGRPEGRIDPYSPEAQRNAPHIKS